MLSFLERFKGTFLRKSFDILNCLFYISDIKIMHICVVSKRKYQSEKIYNFIEYDSICVFNICNGTSKK